MECIYNHSILGAVFFFLLLMRYWVFGTSDKKQRKQRIISLALFTFAGITEFILLIAMSNNEFYKISIISSSLAELSLIAMWIFDIARDKHVEVK